MSVGITHPYFYPRGNFYIFFFLEIILTHHPHNNCTHTRHIEVGPTDWIPLQESQQADVACNILLFFFVKK
jgi:hypothetical protein